MSILYCRESVSARISAETGRELSLGPVQNVGEASWR